MLGSRTKQINTYGKRAKRVINASSSTASSTRTMSGTNVISIFDDMPTPPPLKNVVAKMKKRENEVPSKPVKVLIPKLVGLQKKKRLSPVLSPVKKAKSARISEKKSLATASADISAVAMKLRVQTFGSAQKWNPTVSTPPRTPLSSVPLNTFGSPAVTQNMRRTSNKPSKLKKPLSPTVDVEIIVMDDDGRTVSKERRVSRTNVEINPLNNLPQRRAYNRESRATIVDSDSDLETGFSLRRPSRRVARKKLVVSSDESGTDEERAPLESATKPKKPALFSKQPRTNSVVEVCIPPPYITSNTKSRDVQKVPPRTNTPAYSVPQSTLVVFQDVPSPIPRPRQLTPIRGRRKGVFRPLSPPSPETVTDLDLSIDLSELNLGHDSFTDHETPEYLKPLLEECHQLECGPHNFSGFIESFPYDLILQSARDSGTFDMAFKKIGEASYSEVFGIGDVVLKIIPLCDESQTCVEEVDGPAPTNAKDVRKEIIVTRAMCEVYSGFVKLLKTYVVRGRYPEVLLRLWDEYNERKGSESVRPGEKARLLAIFLY